MLTSHISSDRPALSITVGSELRAVQDVLVLIDTGFTAELKIPQELADQLGIKGEYVERVSLAVGPPVEIWVGTAYVSLEDQTKKVSVLIGGKPSIGVGLLRKFGCILNIDFTKGILTLKEGGSPTMKEDYDD